MSDEQTAEQLQPGDVAVLKSGGPLLTVLDVGRHTSFVWCRWANSDGGINESMFPAWSLTKETALALSREWQQERNR
jgi:uncharacterized protein YodC (DUF2158 family)